MRMMNAHSLARRTLIAAASLALLPAFAQSPALADTLAKLSASKTITLGVRIPFGGGPRHDPVHRCRHPAG